MRACAGLWNLLGQQERKPHTNFRKIIVGDSQKIRKIFFQFRKNSGNNFFACEKVTEIFFRENPYTYSPTKQNYLQPPKTPGIPCQNPKFSDVIAIEGYRRASGSLFRTFLPEIYAKKTEPVKAHYFYIFYSV